MLATHTLVQKMNLKIQGLVKMNELFVIQTAFFTRTGFQKVNFANNQVKFMLSSI